MYKKIAATAAKQGSEAATKRQRTLRAAGVTARVASGDGVRLANSAASRIGAMHSETQVPAMERSPALKIPPAVEAESLTRILEVFHESTGPFSDLDETIEERVTPSVASTAAAAKVERGDGPHSITRSPSVGVAVTHRSFSASLTCPKKFYLFQHCPELVPKLSIGEAVRLDDNASFNELARRWDRLQFGSKAILIEDGDFDQAVQHTEDVITNYFNTTYAALGEQAPSLTIHRPAFSAPFGGNRLSSTAAHPLVLRARPCVLRFRPKDNQWVVLESQSIVDPFMTTTRTGQCLQRLHFSFIAFRYWITQPHIPIGVRKRFLNIDLENITNENSSGRKLETSARASAPIDLKRSGLLHIRQFFPGPATLMDCDPPRLVKFIQRLSLEDLLENDCKTSQKTSLHGGCTGEFDMQNIESMHPEIVQFQNDVSETQQHICRVANLRTARSTRQKDADFHRLFDAQQRLMEALLQHHTVKLVEKSKDVKQVERWTTFSRETPDGCVQSTYAQVEEQQRRLDEEQQSLPVSKSKGKRGKKAMHTGTASCLDTPLIPIVPCFSENIGTHCSRGDVCPFFTEGMCLPQKVSDPLQTTDNHLFTLPSSSVSKKVVWWAEGIRTIRDVLYKHKKGELKLTAPQLRYVKAVADGQIAIHPGEIASFFEKVQYPAFFIDFEATQFALPPFEKAVAFQSIPFQFSLDVFQHDILTETPTHYDFLHFGKGYSPNVDPRKACIHELLRIVALEREKKRKEMEASGELDRLLRSEDEEVGAAKKNGQKRSGRPSKPKPPKITRYSPASKPATPYDGCFIAHFASFEKSCLEKMGQLEEQFKETIKQFYFLDTMDLFKKGLVHPNAGGSNSLKKVLPAMCPDFQYGVFGHEAKDDADGENDSFGLEDAVEDAQPDEQRGENVVGVFRLWYHQEGGGTIQDLQRSQPLRLKASAQAPAPPVPISKEMRDKVWATLRIQLLEYCSLDTKALYEIMRQIWMEREAVKDTPPVDKSGWVFAKPTVRVISF